MMSADGFMKWTKMIENGENTVKIVKIVKSQLLGHLGHWNLLNLPEVVYKVDPDKRNVFQSQFSKYYGFGIKNVQN